MTLPNISETAAFVESLQDGETKELCGPVFTCLSKNTDTRDPYFDPGFEKLGKTKSNARDTAFEP